MNTDLFEGNWAQMKGRFREEWGRLTDDDLEEAKGRRERLVGIIQERYGKAREDVERELAEWENRFLKET